MSATRPIATPRTRALWMKHRAFCNEDEATEALCDFRDHGNTLETELGKSADALAEARVECERLKEAAALDEEMFHQMRLKITAMCGDEYKLHPEALDAIAAELARLRDNLAASHERIRELDGRYTETLARLRTEVERLSKQIKDDNRSYGCELRDPNGTIWEQAAKDHARAERAEAQLALKNSQCERAEQAAAGAQRDLAAARKDSERLDWVLSKMTGAFLPANNCCSWRMDHFDYGNNTPSRRAIDAAITTSNHKTT